MQYLGLDVSGKGADPVEAFRILGLDMGSVDGTTKTLRYELYDTAAKVGDVRLWYDPNNIAVVKRAISKGASGGGGILTET